MQRIIFFALLAVLCHAGDSYTFLDREATGAAQFITSHPEFDGRGTIIFIVDSGVDISVPGLQLTSLDSIKIIDVHDFSGEGNIPLVVADAGVENNERYLTNGDIRLYGYDAFLPMSVDSVFYMGMFSETQFISAAKADINANGRRDDRYGVVVFQDTAYVWRAVVDLDADGNLYDEKIMDDYAKSRTPLAFRSGEIKSHPLGIAFKIDMDHQKAVFHFDAGGHGTHVAGIAAGYNIGGLKGFHGIAPGARIISLKIGDERFGGAATTSNSMRRAYNFIADYAERHPRTPLIVNMSYGLGSEIEGASDMEYIINETLESHDNIYICLSAGNEGPGLSSIGLPATAEHALSIGAVNTARNARDNFASFITDDKLFDFSSRGGESAKPDVVAPGSALSSVPPFSDDGIKSGTSMAAPQASGACALLLSAVLWEHNVLPDMYTLKRAVKYSARPLPGYSIPDQGYGMIRIPQAHALLNEMLKNRPAVKAYTVRTYNADEDHAATAVYWRNAGIFPKKDNSQAVYISPIFPDSLKNSNRIGAFTLKSTAPWLHTIQKNVFIKNDDPTEIEVYADDEALRAPGVYSARIEAYASRPWWKSAHAAHKLFDFPVTIIIPEFADIRNDYRLTAAHTLAPGDIFRQFIQVPAAATSMAVSRFPVSDKGSIRLTLFDPEGHEYKPSVFLRSASSARGVLRVAGDRLKPGIWEAVYYNPHYKSDKTPFKHTVVFGGLHCRPSVIRHIERDDMEAPSALFDVVNRFQHVYKARIHGQLNGIQKKIHLNQYEGTYTYDFDITDSYKNVHFDISINARDFTRFTDCVVRVYDENDRVVVNNALTYRELSFTYVPEKSGAYRLEVSPAFTNDENDRWSMEFIQSFDYFKGIEIYGNSESFYPDVSKQVRVRFKSMPRMAPRGFYLYGFIHLDSRRIDGLRTTIPVKIQTPID